MEKAKLLKIILYLFIIFYILPVFAMAVMGSFIGAKFSLIYYIDAWLFLVIGLLVLYLLWRLSKKAGAKSQEKAVEKPQEQA